MWVRVLLREPHINMLLYVNWLDGLALNQEIGVRVPEGVLAR